MILKISNDGRMAEITLKPTAKVIGGAELARLLLTHGVSAAKIIHHLEIKPTPATGEPAINVARKRRRLFDDKT